MEKKYKTFVGADLHKSFTHFSAIDGRGKELASQRLPNDGALFASFLARFDKPVGVVVETTSNWAWFSEQIKQAGHSVVVAHAAETSARSLTRQKDDQRDARLLASLLRGDMIEKQCWQPPEEILSGRERMRYRQILVRHVAAHKNRIHSVLIRNNLTCPRKDPFCKSGRLWLRSLKLNPGWAETIDTSLRVIEYLEEQLSAIDAWCEQCVRQDELVWLLTTINGINKTLAVMIRFETGDIGRFERVEQFVSYTGLVPGKRQSGEKKAAGIGITKEGSFWLRWAFVQAAQTADRSRGRLSRFFWRQVRSHGNTNRARVATAREIARIAFYVMKRNQGYYEPLYYSTK